MNEKEVMIEFQNRIDALETKIEKISSQVSSCVSLFDRLEKRMEVKIKEYKDFLFKVSILVLVLLGLTVFVASHVFWG